MEHRPGYFHRSSRAKGSHPSRVLRAPFAHASARRDGRLELQLSGELGEDWGLRLTRGLATHRIGVLSGYARLVEPGCWLAQLELDLACGGRSDLDFLGLAMRFSTPPTTPDPRILDFELCASTSFGGSLELRVDAWDSIGLLAAVLGRAARASLHPHEIVLETEDGCAFHHLVLKGQGGVRPGPGRARVLERSLHSLRGR